MARRPRTKATTDNPVAVAAVIDALMEQVRRNVAGKGDIFQTFAPCQMAAKTADGQFKTLNIHGGMEFMLCGLRMGKRGHIIFVFEPVEAGEFVQYEAGETKVFGMMDPSFGQAVIAGLQLEPDAGGLPAPDTWSAAKDYFVRSFNDLQAAAAKKAADAEKAEKEARTASNSAWGMF